MSITAERLMVEVQADVRQALAKLDQVEAKSASTAARIGKMAKSMGLAFGGAAIVGGIKKSVDLAMNFDATMRMVGVQTDTTGKKLTRLGDLALQMGKDTVFSAQDASGAMLNLAKGGLGAADIRAGALQSTLKLAAAGGLDLANAAEYVTQGMVGFGLKAKDADSIVTALAGGANASTASVESLGTALGQVGPGAVNAGMSLQETVSALAAFDNAGIKGSDAGTSLKTMLARLVPQTTKAADAMDYYGMKFIKADGSFKSMSQVAETLRKGLSKLSDSQRTQALNTIFGSDASRAASVLMKNGAEGVKKYMKATKDSTKAQDMANAAMEGAKGAWENFKGSVETAAIQLGTKMLPAFTKVANKGGEFIDTMMTWGPQIKETFGWVPDLFRGLADALGPIVGLVKSTAEAFAGLPGPVKSMVAEGALAVAIFPRLAAAASSAQARVVGSFTAMSTKARQFGAEMTYAETRGAALGRMAKAAAGPAGMLAMVGAANTSNEALKTLGTTAGAAAVGFSMGGPWGAAIGGIVGGFMSLKGHAERTETAIEKTYARIKEAGGPVKSAQTSLNSLKDTLDQVTGAYTGATRAAVLQKLQQSGLVDTAAKAGVSQRELINAALGQEGAWRRTAELGRKYEDQIAAITEAEKEAQREYAANLREGRGSDGALKERIFDLDRQRVALREQIATLRKMPGQLREQAKEVRATAQATADYTGKLKGIPKRVRAQIEAVGIKPTETGVARLAKRYDLMDRKHVKTLVEATGTEMSVKKIMRLIDKMKELEHQKPKPKADLDDLLAKRKASDLTRLLLGPLSNATAKPKADLRDNATGPLRALNSLITSTNGRTITITTVHKSVTTGGGGGGGGGGGVDPKAASRRGGGPRSGAYDMFDSGLGDMAQRARVSTQMAFRGATDAADKGGKEAAEAAAEAAKEAAKKAREKLKRLMDIFRDAGRDIRDGFGDDWEQAQAKMADLRTAIKKTFDGKAEARWLKVAAAANNQLQGLYARRADLAARLEEANQKVADLESAKAAFRESVFSGMNSQATVLNAGNTAGAIAQNLGTQVAKVKEFATLLGQLRSMGYSDAVVMQVASAGVEGGMQAAKALAAASGSEMASINSSMATITAQANSTADALAGGMYDAGIGGAKAIAQGLQSQYDTVVAQTDQIAYALHQAMRKELKSGLKNAGRDAGQGLIEGLKDKKGPLGEAAAEMAREIVRALKAELKIKSPSRITRSLGRFVPQGLALGILDDTRKVSRAAGTMANAAVPSWDYRGTPTPDALSGGQRAGQPVSFTFISHNPQAEPESRTTNAALSKVGSLGLV